MGIPHLNRMLYGMIISLIGVISAFTIPSFTADDWATTTVSRMTLAEKVGQLFMVVAATDPEWSVQRLKTHGYKSDPDTVARLITQYHVGGVIFLGMTDLTTQLALTRKFQDLSSIPLLIGQDLERGLGTRINNAISFPYATALGAMADESIIYEIGKEIGRQARLIGVTIVFAPVVDVNNNPNNPVINIRSLGSNPEAVARQGALFAQGLQDAHVLACAKHFIGHGDTSVDSHSGLPRITHTRDRLDAVELYPFRHLIHHGVSAIMTAHLAVPALDPTPHLPCSLSYPMVTGILRNEFGFKGLIITDALDMQGVTNQYTPAQAALHALQAGNDILLCSPDVPTAHAAILQAVEDGSISEQELDAHVIAIVRAKQALLSHDVPLIESAADSLLNTQHTKNLKARAYEQAITLINNNDQLPIRSPSTTAYLQIGGSYPSILSQAITDALPLATYHAPSTLSEKQTQELLETVTGYDTILISIFDITRDAAEKYGISSATINLITALRNQSKIVLLLFGTPYSINRCALPHDTILIAYDADPDAQHAAAQVVIGTKQAPGRLSINTH